MRKILKSFMLHLSLFVNNMPLKNKLLACYGSLIIFSVAVGGVFSYYNIQSYITKQAGDSFKQTLDQIQMNIEYKLNVYDRLASQIISDQSLVYVLYRDYSESDYSFQYLDTIKPIFSNKENDDSIEDIFLFKNNNTLTGDGGNFIDIESISNKWWFKKYFSDWKKYNINDYIRISKSVFWVITEDDLKKQNSSVKTKRVSIIKPIIFNYEKLVGILAINVKYDAIFGELSAGNNSKGDYIVITDENKNTVYSSTDLVQILDTAKCRNEGNSGDNTIAGFFTTKENGKLLSLYTKGEYSAWNYSRFLSMERLMESARPIRSFAVFNGLISVIISFSIGVLIASMISKRLAVLSDAMERVDDLTLDIKVHVDGKDEIGIVAKNYNKMIKRIKGLVEVLEISNQSQRQAELKALQAQINPHFLYNALATINWMAMSNDNKKIVSMVRNLSTFYRLTLNKGREYLKIEDEMALTKAYTDIQKVRWEEKINIVFDFEEDIKQFHTLKLVLQPFVENAIMHGAEYKYDETTNILIKGYKDEGKIMLEVIDDGMGMKKCPDVGSFSASRGYGIRNVHEKITLRFGAEYGVKITSRLGIGTKVSISIPEISENPDI